MKIRKNNKSKAYFLFNSFNSRAAMTLVEIIIAAAILSLILGVFYQIFIAAHKGFNAGAWMANLTQEMNVGFRQMQEDIRGTAILTANTPDTYFKTSPKNPAFDFNYNRNLTSAPGLVAGGGDVDVMKFTMCRQPQKSGFESKNDNQPAIIENARYWLNDKKELWYEKKACEWNGKPNEAPDLKSFNFDKTVSKRAMIHDVESIKFIPAKAGASIEREKMFAIEIIVAPPKNQGREVKPLIKSTQVTVNVEPKSF